MTKLLSCTSVSGGKTSSYMALHYPTDLYLFAPVLSKDPSCLIQDKSLRQYCQGKVSWFDWERWGSREVDLTLSNLRKLEQELGKEITWVPAPFTYDDLIHGSIEPPIAKAFNRSVTKKAMLPKSTRRFCTEALKIYPIAWHCYLYGNGLPIVTNVGFRYDESERVHGWKCDRTSMTLKCDIQGKYRRKHRHELVDYRLVRFPLYEDGIEHDQILVFWKKKRWIFPSVSNCDFCFFHLPREHREQQETYPDRVAWWLRGEKVTGSTFGKVPLASMIANPDKYSFAAKGSCFCTD